MKVDIHAADLGGCGYYRLLWPAEALRAQGHEVTKYHDRDVQCVWQDTIQGPTIIGLHDELDCDVFVLQRPLTRNRYELIKAIRAQGIAVVVEIDDDFHAIDRRNPAWRFANPLTDKNAHRDWLMRSCAEADLVTCTTPALAHRYGNGHCVVLDNYVPRRYTNLPREPHDTVRVGWSGSTITHPGDLEVTGGGVAQAIHDTGSDLFIVGTGLGVSDALQWDGPALSTEWLDIIHYPGALARMDVGVVPLIPNDFNEAKSHLKGLEYASVGVPFVATPTGPYASLSQQGIGWLAETPADWRWLTAELARDKMHREALSEQYRAAVAESWTVEGNAWRWWEAWEQALVNRRASVAA